MNLPLILWILWKLRVLLVVATGPIRHRAASTAEGRHGHLSARGVRSHDGRSSWVQDPGTHTHNWLVVSTPLKKSQLGLLFPIYINILYYMEVNKKCSKPPTSDSKCASKRLILTLQQSSIFPSKTIYLNSSSFFSMSRIGKKNTQNLNFHGTPPVDSLETCQRDHGENMISSGVQ